MTGVETTAAGAIGIATTGIGTTEAATTGTAGSGGASAGASFASLALAGAGLSPALQILLGLIAGALLGLVHFGSLRFVARRYAEGGAGLALLVQLARFAVLGAVLFALAKVGAAALLAGAVGLLVARHLVVRRLGGLRFWGLPWARR